MKKDLVELINASEQHVQLIYNWRNQKFIRNVMYCSDLIPWENHTKWMQKMLQDDMKFLKVLYYNNTPYGIANFSISDVDASVGEWGFYIGEKNAPKGMGKLLAYTMLHFLFEEQKVRKVCAEVIAFNEISLSFHKKVGFSLDGVLRKHILKNNNYQDIYLFSIFKDEWSEIKPRLERELFE